MTSAKCYVAAMFLIIVIASDVHTAEYTDYDGVGSSDSEGHSNRDLYETIQQSGDPNSAAKLWNIPLQHLMVRKSQRSPSLRLRFGRRSDPLLANDISSTLLGQDSVDRKSVRSPSYRLRFGRRTDPEFSEDYMGRKASRSPSLRLRFGRRSDPAFLTHDLTDFFPGDDYLDRKIIRSPSYRLRFGRASDNSVGSTEDQLGKNSETESPDAGVEEN
ncbi:short neuropeptide F [Athalia rosae]|uniref:short neuropeptide F n=1 Tax=Athalia rosae TaxID=37344 RepID=UPI0006260541|nr:short neuropeptide F [Athalia rosae]